ncbi:MAG: acetyl/propionyl/methylcrotonyl-CoA carboxylase subunit alpha [Burkholderiales bacterium]|nr:acetyl/propionyl/methylcrotonyl-CoA carboxylase subunit alpha [Burkholderiales bacterium]
MFRKILIANRGEIACRVIKTARRLGIRTVAVFSQADADARHTRLADEAVQIGASEARDSYLNSGRVIAAAKATGAQAIHPGYGFLAENEAFAAECAAAGIVFVGPPVESIRAMGSKSAAKTLMEKAAVPLVPGYHGDNQDPGFLQREADRIGYPLMLKPSAGGGGKGMRVVDTAGGFAEALASCKREAMSSFGDGHVLIERYVTRPRHIEIQVFADRHGHCVHLFERDCSVQRRHQKVLEEAPAPGMTDARRREMGAAAVAAARAVNYEGAGTVEFIADQDGRFYFMEMNTRLQVEHPVTEMITGQDLVEWQLRVAAGEPLPLTQEQLAIRGHALEARIYAEDPERGFLPSTGRLVHLAPPPESLHVRVDSGVDQGDEITPYYDPLIAKLIVWDHTRELALQRMLQALAQYRIVGVANNVEFLSRLVASPAFAHADMDTGLIEREHGFLFPQRGDAPDQAYFIAALATLLREDAEVQARTPDHARGDSHSPWRLADGWRLNSQSERRLLFRYAGKERAVVVGYVPGGYELRLDDIVVPAHGELGGNGTLRVEIAGMRLDASVIVAGEKRHVFLDGHCYALSRVDPLFVSGEGQGVEGGLFAPMPGKVIAWLAQPPVDVDRGAPLLILEAMKMEHTITAPTAGRLNGFHFAVGEQVTEGAELVDFEKRA